jgi:hypothetical protein
VDIKREKIKNVLFRNRFIIPGAVFSKVS